MFVTEDFFAPEVRSLALSPDGKRRRGGCGQHRSPLGNGHGQGTASARGPLARAPSAIVLSADGKTVVSWGFDRVVRRWEAATGKPLGSFPAPPGTTLAAFSSRWPHSSPWRTRTTRIRLHDTATGKELRRLKGHGQRHRCPGLCSRTARCWRHAAGTTTASAFTTWRRVSSCGKSPFGQRPDRPSGTVIVSRRRPAGDGTAVLAWPFRRTASSWWRCRRGRQRPQQHARSSSTSPPARNCARSSRRSPSPASPFRRTAAPSPRRTPTERSPSGKSPVAKAKPAGQGRRRTAAQATRGMMAFQWPSMVVSAVRASRAVRSAGLLARWPSPGGARVGPIRSRSGTWPAGKEIGQLKGHTGRIETVAFAADGKTLASGATRYHHPAVGHGRSDEGPGEAAESRTAGRGGGGRLGRPGRRGRRQGFRRRVQAGRCPRAGRALSGQASEAGNARRSSQDRRLDCRPREREVCRASASGRQPVEGGEQAVPALRKKLASVPPLETRKRVEELVDRADGRQL